MERLLTDARPLPDGWRWATLGEVGRIVNGSTPKSGVEDSREVMSSGSRPRPVRSILQCRCAHRERCAGSNHATTLVPPGSVPFASPIGHAIASVPRTNGLRGVCASAHHYRVSTLRFVDELRALGSGATFEVSAHTLRSPARRPYEQRRIVATSRACDGARRSADGATSVGDPFGVLGSVFPSSDSGATGALAVGTSGDCDAHRGRPSVSAVSPSRLDTLRAGNIGPSLVGRMGSGFREAMSAESAQ